MTRQLDKDSLEALKLREGLKLVAYDDAHPNRILQAGDRIDGTLTIGYGHTGPDVTIGKTISEAEAESLLDSDCRWACAAVEQNCTAPLTDNQFGALVSFCYNIGETNFRKSSVLKAVNDDRYADVPEAMMLWIEVDHHPDDGLKNRRNSEGGQFVRGSYVRGASITPTAPPPIWRHPAVLKAAGAIGTGAASVASHINADNVQKAADAASAAAAKWHQFGNVAMILTGICVFWMLFGKKI